MTGQPMHMLVKQGKAPTLDAKPMNKIPIEEVAMELIEPAGMPTSLEEEMKENPTLFFKQSRKIYKKGGSVKLKKKSKKDPRLAKNNLEGYNKPKRTPNHPTKSHVVLAKVGDVVKLIRFGEQGAKTAGKPKKGESVKMKKKRASFKARHAKNIKKGKLSAAYWADKVKW